MTYPLTAVILVVAGRRDVRHSYDTFTASSATIATPEGYRQERRRTQMANIDELQERLDALFSSEAGEGDDSSSLTSIDTTAPQEEGTLGHRTTQYLQTGMYTDTASSTTAGGTNSMGQSPFFMASNSEQWSPGLSEQSLLRFPLSKIGALVPQANETIAVLGGGRSTVHAPL